MGHMRNENKDYGQTTRREETKHKNCSVLDISYPLCINIWLDPRPHLAVTCEASKLLNTSDISFLLVIHT